MGQIMAGFTMSLDGFIAEPDNKVDRLFGWYMSGDTDFPVPGTDMVFKISSQSAEMLREIWNFGALVTGRGDFDASNAWGGNPPLEVPVFIVTRRVPQEWVYEGSPFTFVTEGVEAALKLAKEVANGQNIAVGGTTIVQQCLKAGLLDQIHIDLVPLLLGKGIRLFDNLDGYTFDLERTRAITAPDVTHLTYRVVK